MSKTLDDLIEREEASHAESEGAKAFVEKFRELLAGAKFKRPDLDAEISRLTARIAELEQRLKPFAAMAPVFPDNAGYVVCRVRACDDLDLKITGADLHAAARTTLEASERGGGE